MAARDSGGRSEPPSTLLTFISYSHAQPKHLAKLRAHLVQLEREELIRVWDDSQLKVGQLLGPALEAELERTELFVLLVTQDFIASGYCFNVEMQKALERHRLGNALVVPIIVAPCDWQQTELADVVAAPRDGRPISSWSPRDAGWTDATRRIRAAALAFREHKPKSTKPYTTQSEATETVRESPSASTRPPPPVKVRLEYNVTKQTAQLHEYELLARVINLSDRRLDDWDLELTFPTRAIWPSLTARSPGFVYSDTHYSIIRQSSREEGAAALYPDESTGLHLNYRMNNALYSLREYLYKQPIILKAFVDGKLVAEIKEPFEKYQRF